MVTPKFKLIGTSFYALHPEMSLALIDEPGKGIRWVRQTSKIEHLVIDKVENGKIVIRDGQRTEELVAERPPVRSLIKGETPLAGEQPQPTMETTVVSETGESLEERAKIDQAFILLLTATLKEAESKKDPNEDDKAAAEATKELLISETRELQSRIVSKEEANNLKNLGQQLKEVRKEPNQPPVPPPARRPMRVPPRDRRIPTR